MNPTEIDYPALVLTFRDPDAVLLEGIENLKVETRNPNFMTERASWSTTRPPIIKLALPQNAKNGKYGQRYLVINSKSSDYEKYNCLSSLMTDVPRAKSRKFNEPTLHETWNRNRAKIVSEVTKMTNFPTMNPFELINQYREATWRIGKRGECTSHRPIVTAALCKLFRAKKMIDFCAGWGDRMIGALGSDAEYLGVDPNSQTIKIFNEFITRLSLPNVNVLECCAEFSSQFLTESYYDLMFTSPPYFDEEAYSDEDTQSIKMYDSYEKWVHGFLHGMLKNAIYAVRNGGKIAVNIVDFNRGNRRYPLMKDTIDYMIGAGQHFDGTIWYKGERGAMPIFIFTCAC